MKFTKLAKSDKFEYMMLSRLIQDAKYFIEHPDLKHLWARTLDEHIKQLKEQYAKLDPKPEWTSEEEINNLAKQMKESYTNHWNEVHPDNKIEAAIQQPNKPKPTTILPDNLEWSWDPNAADWVAVLKDNQNVTPPLYNPNNQNVVNQNTTSYMSAVKSSCLSKFLDGPQYSKEIKIEAGLIKDGLVKYAGFDFNRGTKYAITTKGLEVLRKASEAEHNEALNEREKLAYMFGFNTDKVSTLDTTGKVIKQSAKKWTICEADGTELGEVEANSELDAKVKFGIEHPEYADSQSICAKEIDAKYEETTESHEPYPNPSETPNDHIILENHDGWVNTAAQVTPEFAKLHKLLGEYKKQDLIQLSDLDGNLVASGDPQIINELEHQVKEIGYYCESVDEYTDSDYAETYSLKIFMK